MVCGCVVDRGGTRRISSALSFALDHPFLMHGVSLWDLGTLSFLSLRSDMVSVRQTLVTVGEDRFRNVMMLFLQKIPRRRLLKTLPDIVNDPLLQHASNMMMNCVPPEHMAEVLNAVPVSKIAITLRCPAEALVEVALNVDRDRWTSCVIPMLVEQESKVLEENTAGVLQHMEQPKRIADLINHVPPSVLMLLAQSVPAECASALLNVLQPTDFQPESNCMRFLQLIADQPGLLSEKIGPLLSRVEAKKMAVLSSGIRPDKTLNVLLHVDVDGLLRLIQHLKPELSVRLFNGPFQNVLDMVSVFAADAMQDVATAEALKRGSYAVDDGLTAIDTVREGFLLGLDGLVNAGKSERGSQPHDPYQIGDISRGLLSVVRSQLTVDGHWSNESG